MIVITLSLAPVLALAMQDVPDPNTNWYAEFGVEEVERDPETGELPVEPYVQSNDNAGATQFSGDSMAKAFNGQDGIRRIAERTVDLSRTDPRISGIFLAHDMVRLRRTLFEQFCFILNAGCDYTGRDMKSSHEGLGTTRRDLNALVENLQQAMREEGVSFQAQNRFLAKLAPMSVDVTER
jgi:hemoglobin